MGTIGGFLIWSLFAFVAFGIVKGGGKRELRIGIYFFGTGLTVMTLALLGTMFIERVGPIDALLLAVREATSATSEAAIRNTVWLLLGMGVFLLFVLPLTLVATTQVKEVADRRLIKTSRGRILITWKLNVIVSDGPALYRVLSYALTSEKAFIEIIREGFVPDGMKDGVESMNQKRALKKIYESGEFLRLADYGISTLITDHDSKLSYFLPDLAPKDTPSPSPVDTHNWITVLL
jgi:hypothetical protein